MKIANISSVTVMLILSVACVLMYITDTTGHETQIRQETGKLTPDHPNRVLLDAIRAYEGWKGVATDDGTTDGPYCIGRDYWTDGARFGKVEEWINRYEELVVSLPHCEYIIWSYWEGYGARTDEERARIHNGGPSGATRRGTLEYWEHVKNLMG